MLPKVFDAWYEKNITIPASWQGKHILLEMMQVCSDAEIDEINRRFGRGSLFHLAEGIKRPWTMKREMLTPSWNQLPEVK